MDLDLFMSSATDWILWFARHHLFSNSWMASQFGYQLESKLKTSSFEFSLLFFMSVGCIMGVVKNSNTKWIAVFTIMLVFYGSHGHSWYRVAGSHHKYHNATYSVSYTQWPGPLVHNDQVLFTSLLTWVTTIFLTTNSAKGSMDLYSTVMGLSEQGAKGSSAFSGQYTSHFFWGWW